MSALSSARANSLPVRKSATMLRPGWAGLTGNAPARLQNARNCRACRRPVKTGSAGKSFLPQDHAGKGLSHLQIDCCLLSEGEDVSLVHAVCTVSESRLGCSAGHAVARCRVQDALPSGSVLPRVLCVRRVCRRQSACTAESHAALRCGLSICKAVRLCRQALLH